MEATGALDCGVEASKVSFDGSSQRRTIPLPALRAALDVHEEESDDT
jgi:hypothetical protein